MSLNLISKIRQVADTSCLVFGHAKNNLTGDLLQNNQTTTNMGP